MISAIVPFVWKILEWFLNWKKLNAEQQQWLVDKSKEFETTFQIKIKSRYESEKQHDLNKEKWKGE